MQGPLQVRGAGEAEVRYPAEATCRSPARGPLQAAKQYYPSAARGALTLPYLARAEPIHWSRLERAAVGAGSARHLASASVLTEIASRTAAADSSLPATRKSKAVWLGSLWAQAAGKDLQARAWHAHSIKAPLVVADGIGAPVPFIEGLVVAGDAGL